MQQHAFDQNAMKLSCLFSLLSLQCFEGNVLIWGLFCTCFPHGLHKTHRGQVVSPFLSVPSVSSVDVGCMTVQSHLQQSLVHKLLALHLELLRLLHFLRVLLLSRKGSYLLIFFFKWITKTGTAKNNVILGFCNLVKKGKFKNVHLNAELGVVCAFKCKYVRACCLKKNPKRTSLKL